jgi:hypothetical protein
VLVDGSAIERRLAYLRNHQPAIPTMEAVPVSTHPAPGEVEVRAYVVAGPWTTFFVAVQFLLLFPLLPLGAELVFTGQITVASLALVTATYVTSLALSSRSLALWSSGSMMGICFSAMFGWATAQSKAPLGPAYRLGGGETASPAFLWAPLGVLAGIFFLHLAERYVRHVRHKELFPEFLKPVR